jgi:hypothetical protein
MYPRRFFDTFWRGDIRKDVFVAMPMNDEFNSVYEQAIYPAISDSSVGMQPKRVDASVLSGAIVTDILDGIAHSTLVFADISIMKTGRWKGQRNGNVMYELGLAHAIRPETDVIVVRSDDAEINFDIAGINIRSYPDSNLQRAKDLFANYLADALKERDTLMSLIMRKARERLDRGSLNLMWEHGEKAEFQPFAMGKEVPLDQQLALQRLLDLDILRCEIPEHLHFHYAWTDFGKAVFHHPNFPDDQAH